MPLQCQDGIIMTKTYDTITRNKVRFPSIRGPISAEQVWDVPLIAKDGFSLDDIAKEVNGRIKECSVESFVTDNIESREKTVLDAMLTFLKHVIATKIDERDKALDSRRKSEQAQTLMAAIHRKETSELDNLSVEELKKRLADLT